MGDARKLDYAAVSVKDYSAASRLEDHFGFEYVPCPSPNKAFRQAMKAVEGGSMVFFDNVNPDYRDVWHFQISGDGCRAIEARPGFPGWQEYLKSAVDLGAKASRIDFAIDNLDGSILMDDVRAAVVAGHVVRKGDGRTGDAYFERKQRNGLARTQEVGSRKSDVFMRCYDKGIEQGETRSWLRFEFEFKGKRAHQVLCEFIDKGWDHVCASFRGFIDFREPIRTDTNKSRWPVSVWWSKLISESRHTLASIPKAPQDVQKMWRHLEKQFGKAAATFAVIAGGDMTFLYDLVSKGAGRMTPWEWNRAYRVEREMLTYKQAIGSLGYGGGLSHA